MPSSEQQPQPRISISYVMPYWNRRTQLEVTLRTMRMSTAAAQTEVIVIDDASDEAERIECLVGKFLPLTVRVRRIDPAKRFFAGSLAVPCNIGATLAAGEMLVLASPECVHAGDVLAAVAALKPDSGWTAFPCYSVPPDLTASILANVITHAVPDAELGDFIRKAVGPLNARCATHNFDHGWYCHRVHRPAPYNFCAAIPKAIYTEIGGFDLRFAMGAAYEDNDILERLAKRGVPVGIADEFPMTFHLAHARRDGPDNAALYYATRGGDWKANGGRLLDDRINLDLLMPTTNP